MKEMTLHDWASLGDDGERIPRWPSRIDEKRPINIRIHSWVGTSPGAKHFYVDVEEKENQWWSESNNGWATITCDSEKSGYSFRAEVMTENEALDTALFFAKMIHKDKNGHTINWSYSSILSEPRWVKEFNSRTQEVVKITKPRKKVKR